jgi:alpha-L-fucosidase
MTTESSAVEQTRAAILRRVVAGIAEGPFRADWDSLTTGYRVPDWYVDGKFGIFIHWGPYSVPAYSSEWYPREMYRQGTAVYEHHRQTHGPTGSSATRTSSPSSPGQRSTPPSGPAYSAGRAPSSSCRWQSTTTGFPCTRPI